ncbi:MAG: 3-deoxy-7-phosphoheptulonate synthase [Actinomycetota bacterium]
MVVVMKKEASDADVERVAEKVREVGGEAFISRGTVHTIIGLVGDTSVFRGLDLDNLPGVDHLIQIGKPYKMVARALHPQPTTVKVGPAAVGRGLFTMIAGPCAVESEEQAMEAARSAKDAGATILRGGAFKPRTSPYSFQGLGERGLEILAECRSETGLPVVTEVVEPRDVELVAAWADGLQIGTRKMQNFALLKEVGATSKPVLLKRGLSATIEEWLMAAEYIAQRGNSEIILCERGIRTFEPSTRFTLDLAGMAVAQQESHLPVIVDPSHATGLKELVAPMARAAIAAGADGVMIDVHANPGAALCDGPQALSPDELQVLSKELHTLAGALGRQVD